MKAEKLDNTHTVDLENYNSFKKSIKFILDDIVTKLYDDNKQLIRVKKSSQSVENLKRIIHTAIAISNKKGYAAMSMRELSSASSLSIGALYAYFPSKDELLHIIQQYGRSSVEKVLSQVLITSTTSKEKLRNFLYAHIYISEVLKDWFYFSYMETRYFTGVEYSKTIQGELLTESLIKDILIEGIQRNEFRGDSNCELIASISKAMLQDWYLKRWKYRKRNVTPDEYAHECFMIIYNYIKK